MRILDKIIAYGHPNIRCTHDSTIEITKEKNLTVRGNCILGVKATKACYDLSDELKNHIWNQEKITVLFEADEYKDEFIGFGNKKLLLTNKNEIVFRTSKFICDRTILIKCSKSSSKLNRELINTLTTFNKKIKISFLIDDQDE